IAASSAVVTSTCNPPSTNMARGSCRRRSSGSLSPPGKSRETTRSSRQRTGLRRSCCADQVEEGWPDEQSGREVANDGAELQPLGERGPDDRSRQDDKCIDENTEISPVHPPPIAVLTCGQAAPISVIRKGCTLRSRKVSDGPSKGSAIPGTPARLRVFSYTTERGPR